MRGQMWVFCGLAESRFFGMIDQCCHPLDLAPCDDVLSFTGAAGEFCWKRLGQTKYNLVDCAWLVTLPMVG
jgi:hypothetical protein